MRPSHVNSIARKDKPALTTIAESVDDSDEVAVPPDDHQNAVSPDGFMYDDHREPEPIARDRFRRKTGYTILKRRRRELQKRMQKRMYSFSPTVVYTRLILNNSDEDDDNNESDKCEHSLNHFQSETYESTERKSIEKKVRKKQRNDSKWKRNVEPD